jgi:tetratricopeptide (TPR) repeat protein
MRQNISKTEKMLANIGDQYQTIKNNPFVAKEYQKLGDFFRDSAYPNKAVRAYLKTLEIDPNYARAYWEISNILYQQGKVKKAIEFQQKALDIDPGFAQAETHYDLGNMLFQEGKLEQAIRSYRRAVYIKPRWAEAYFALGKCLFQIEKTKKSVSYWSSTTELVPIGQAYLEISGVLKELDYVEESFKYKRLALEAMSNSFTPEAHIQVGDWLTQSGNPDEAIKFYLRAASISLKKNEASSKLSSALKQYLTYS